jgi:hypothetical protein
MRKKLLYTSIITIVFAAPIIYWLYSRWGVTMTASGLKKIAHAFASDRFLLFATICNISLYAFAMFKVSRMNPEGKAAQAPAASAAPRQAMPGGMRSAPADGHINPNDPKWQGMYGAKPAAQKEAAPEAAAPSPPAQDPKQNKPAEAAPEAAAASSPPPPAETVNNASAGDTDDEVLNLAEDTMKDVYKSKINDLLAEKGYESIGSATIDGVEADFVGIAESDTLVLGIINARYGDIIANEISTDPNVPPSWFTNEKKYNSPVWEAKAAATAVEKMIKEVLPEDSGVNVSAIVVIPNANVVNRVDMEKKWEEQEVAVTKFLNYSDLPDLRQTLPDKTGAETLPSFKKFAETLMKYFNQKAKAKPMRKAG